MASSSLPEFAEQIIGQSRKDDAREASFPYSFSPQNQGHEKRNM
jgi:hypothetical protein